MLTSDDDSVATTSGDTEMYLLCANGCGTIIAYSGTGITTAMSAEEQTDGSYAFTGEDQNTYTLIKGLYNYGVDAEVGPA